MLQITIDRLLAVAGDLASEHGENPEYDRALVEMASALLGLTTDDRHTVARLAGVKSQGA